MNGQAIRDALVAEGWRAARLTASSFLLVSPDQGARLVTEHKETSLSMMPLGIHEPVLTFQNCPDSVVLAAARAAVAANETHNKFRHDGEMA